MIRDRLTINGQYYLDTEDLFTLCDPLFTIHLSANIVSAENYKAGADTETTNDLLHDPRFKIGTR